MKKSTPIGIAILILLLALTGCAGNGAIADSHDGDSAGTANTEGEEPDEDTSEVRWLAVPAVFVNDTYFSIFADELHHNVPDLDNTWVSMGTIRSAVPGWEPPTQNFQTNNEAMIGSEIYFSSGGHIPVTHSIWDDPLDEEVIGDIVIVVFEGSRLWYISEEAHSKVMEVSSAVERHSLMVDGVVYSLAGIAGGGNLVIDDSYIFLGEVLSCVPIDEYPAENLQTNRDFVVGMKVYRLPPDDNNDIIAFHSTDAYYFYEYLPGETDDN